MPAAQDDAFAKARRGYVGRLPAALDAIAAAIASLSASTDEPAASIARDDVRTRAHKLRGTAGTYGLEELSECAARLEEATRRPLAESSRNLVSRNLVEDLEPLVAELRRAVERAGSAS